MLYRLCRGRLTFKFYVISVLLFGTLCSLLISQFYSVNQVTQVSLRTKTLRHMSKIVTVIYRHFENYNNEIAYSVKSFASTYPNMPVIVLCESDPYPPILFTETNETLKNVKVLSVQLRLDAVPQDLDPLKHLVTDYVLFVPDSTRVSRRVLQKAVATVSKSEDIVAIAVGNSHIICQNVKWNYADWTLKYSKVSTERLCDAVYGQHAVLTRTSLLHTLPRPFGLPFPELFYLQTSVQNVKVQVLDGKFGVSHNFQKGPTVRHKSLQRLRDQRLALYKELGVKAVIREDGVQWYGCKRETQRCFPPVQGTPWYVLSGRNTPPCCRRNIRRVVAHVLRLLTQTGVRCWLETTSLLGAVVRGDLLPWAEYAEIGIHASDLSRVSWLQRGGVDPEGFVWERATKGNYYRVAYSNTNRVYALILPFSARNGTMWPAEWVLAFQKEFPERHLHPLAQIKFAGRQSPAPNDARAFLDLKLGSGAVERCEKIGPKLLYP